MMSRDYWVPCNSIHRAIIRESSRLQRRSADTIVRARPTPAVLVCSQSLFHYFTKTRSVSGQWTPISKFEYRMWFPDRQRPSFRVGLGKIYVEDCSMPNFDFLGALEIRGMKSSDFYCKRHIFAWIHVVHVNTRRTREYTSFEREVPLEGLTPRAEREKSESLGLP